MRFQPSHRTIIVSSILLLAAILLWQRVIVPEITKLPIDFSYKADIVSLDNFYDEQAQKFSGEKRSVTKFSYDVTNEKDGVLTIKNVFDVHKVTGEKIFTVERLYGIDRKTGKHIAGFGDKDREGYLFAPHHLKKGEPFTFWHINYDGSARINFMEEETIAGLTVYRYETHYEDVRIDQTKDLALLPGVGVTQGIELEPYLQVWIEPVSGHLVKYKDDTVAYYYDLQTGKRLHPWNHFGNTYTPESVSEQVHIAKLEKLTINLLEDVVPIVCGLLALMLMVFYFRKKRAVQFLFFGALIAAILTGAGMWLAPTVTTPETYTGQRTVVRVGLLHFPATAPMLIALEKGYFTEQGLDLDIKIFDSGKAALGTMLDDGDLDIINVAQTPIVMSSFDRQDFVILSGLSSSPNDAKILIRNDRGIHAAKDLRGKTVGITKGTTGHYFLGLFLAQHNLNFTDIQTMDMPASGLPDALRSGKVDAISSWEPHIYNAQKILGANASLLESGHTFRTDYYLVSSKDWAKNNPEIAERFLVAIDKANSFIAGHVREVQDIVATRTNLELQFIQSVWGDYSYRLFLDQAILLTLEQQARWTVANKLTDKPVPSNYLDFIEFDALEQSKPEAVTIIR